MAERPAKVSFGFIDYTPTQKGMFGDNVVAEMTEHTTVFPNPDVPLPTLTDINNALKQKTQQALSGDKVKIQERDATEKEWDSYFRKEGEYVQRIANGSKLIIAQSGYHSTDTESHPVAIPAQPQINAWANKGKGSGIHVEMKPLADCRGFQFIVSSQNILSYMNIKGDSIKFNGPLDVFIDVKLTTKRKVDFQDLNSGQTYFITALGFNASGVGEMANVIEVVAP
jgi:hypothetical protein